MPHALLRPRRALAAGVAALTCAALALGSSPALAGPSKPSKPGKPQADPVPVRIIGFNDLHGNLEPPTGSSGRVTVPGGTTVDAGGAAFLATHVKQLRSEVDNSFVVSAGDAIGASPVISALFHDEPTIEVLNALGLKAMAVGNHEFDEGYQELLRIQRGGCHPTDGCQFRERYRGAKFPILGANVTKERHGLPALLPFTVVRSGGVNVGVIGVTLKGLPDIVSQEGIKGLRFGDEVRAIDRTSSLLQALGIRAQVVLMHQGDEVTPGGGPDSCNVVPGGPAGTIARTATARVDAFMSAHTHQQYSCQVTDPAGNPRPIIQGLSFGRLLSVLDLEVDRRTRDVVRGETAARNVIVTRTVTPDAGVQSIVDRAKTLSAPLANRPIGSIAADILRAPVPSGESPLGNTIADSQLAATTGAGAQVALMNPGGVRADLTYASSPAGEGDGVVTYGEAFTVQPFGNVLQTLTYTGAQLDAVLEQQWREGGTRVVLQPSASLRYSYSESAPIGSKVSAITINGTPVDPAASYRVTVNNFLAAGGDGFTTLRAGTAVTGGVVDLDGFTAYLEANPALAPAPTNRITVRP